MPLTVDDRRHTLLLAGSPRLDAFKTAHKARRSPLAFATDVDLLVVEKHPPGIAAILDVKGPDEPLSFAQVVAFEAFRAALPGVPIFVVAVDDATRGPFRVAAYLRGDWPPRPPVVLLSHPRTLPDWPAFSAWETALRRDFRVRRALARGEAATPPGKRDPDAMNAPYHQQPDAWETGDARTATGRTGGTALVPRDPTAAANLASPRLLEGARRALEEAATLPELTPLIDQAEVVRLAARKAHLSREAQNAWAEYALDAERKAGALLTRLAETGQRAGQGRPAKTSPPATFAPPPTLVELGVADAPAVAKHRASRWQQLASIPDDAYAQFKADVRADPDAVLTRAAALTLAKRLRGPSAHALGHARRAAAFEATARTRVDAGDLPYDVVTASAADDYLDALIARRAHAHLCVTSPAYWMLRTYTDGHPDELGQEPRPADYVARLCATVDRIGRVLLPGGCLYLNLSDTYASQPGQYRGDPERARGISAQAVAANGTAPAGRILDVADKSLCLIPWRVALALVLEHGWRCASIIAWVKDGHAPENVNDRYTRAWEPIFVLTRAEHAYLRREHLPTVDDVWVIPVGRQGAADGHPAPFPDELVERAIAAACPPEGVVLDPFAGSGTVRDVAHRLGRRFLGCDLAAGAAGAPAAAPAAGGPR